MRLSDLAEQFLGDVLESSWHEKFTKKYFKVKKKILNENAVTSWLIWEKKLKACDNDRYAFNSLFVSHNLENFSFSNLVLNVQFLKF